MKQTFLVFLLALFLCSTANAVPFWFDADGDGDKYDATYFHTIHTDISNTYYTYQNLGPDGILNDYDTFYHSSPINLAVKELQVLGNNAGQFDQAVYPEKGSEVYFQLSGLGGEITNYTNLGSGDTTASNFENISDDQFNLKYTPYLGQVDFYFDDTFTDNYDSSNADKIATFEVLKGGGDVLANNNSTLTSDIGFDFLATSITPKHFFFDDNGQKGDDVYNWMLDNPGSNFVIAVADGSVNLTNFNNNNEGQIVLESGQSNGFDVNLYPTPEPATMLLLGLGLLGLAGISRKKLKK